MTFFKPSDNCYMSLQELRKEEVKCMLANNVVGYIGLRAFG